MPIAQNGGGWGGLGARQGKARQGKRTIGPVGPVGPTLRVQAPRHHSWTKPASRKAMADVISSLIHMIWYWALK